MLRSFSLFAACVVMNSFAADPTATEQLDRMERTRDAKATMQDVIQRFRADSDGLAHFYSGLNPSPMKLDRTETNLVDWQKQLELVDFEKLDQEGKIDYLLLKTKLKFERQVIERDRKKLREIEAYLPFRDAVQELERRRYLKQPIKLEEAAAQLAAIPEQVKKVREKIDAARKEKKDDKDKPKEENSSGGNTYPSPDKPAKLDPLLARRTADSVNSVREALKSWYGFYDGYMPEFGWWMKKPHDDADKSLEDFSKFLREEIAGLKGKDEDPLIGEPIGPQALNEDLAREMIPYSAEELIKIAEREFAWCEARLKEASNEMGFGDDWKKALAKVKDVHVPPGQQDQFIAEQAKEAIDFVRAKDLVTVPQFCEETWRVTMIGHEQQKTMPYAAYNGQNILVAFARQEMSTADKQMSMRGNNKHFTRIVTAHELIPGHHLQMYMAQRYRNYRDLFYTSFFVEGWALYWELKLWDLNFAKSSEDRIGMLFWRMHRCARIIVTLNYHLGKMKPQEMIDFLVNRVGHEKFGATSEVRRFMQYYPLYQCGYMIGGLQIRAMHKEMVGSGKMNEREFNDAVLHEGPIPNEMVRAAIENTPLTKEWVPGWKFAE